MKKIKITYYVTFLMLTFMACDYEDANINNIYDIVNGQTGIGFVNSSQSIVVPENGVTISVDVRTTTVSTSDRSFNVSIDDESTGSSQDYSIGSIIIPANSFFGTLDVNFGNFNNLPDLVTNKLILNIDVPEGDAVVGEPTITLNYIKYLICNDLHLTITTDTYGSETTWEIVDSNNNVVQFGGPFVDVAGGATYEFDFNLPDGCYTFNIYDAFGDGLYDGNNTGNYLLSCSILEHASGSGNFGSVESTDFCVNP